MSEKKYTVNAQLKKYPSVLPGLLAFFGGVIVVFLATDYIINFNGINEIGLAFAKGAFKGMFQPNVDKLINMTKNGVPYLLLETLCIALLGTIIGTILSVPFAVFSARNITNSTCSMIGLTIISIIRAFPKFLYGMIFVKIVGTGPFAGVLTIGIGSIGMLTKLLIEAIEDMDRGVIEALDASGCTTIQKIRYGVFPQLSAKIASMIIYRLDINVKDASTLGIVAAGGIGYELIASISGRRWHDTGAYILGLIILVLILEWVSTKLRMKIEYGDK